jgi:hypothetical protein
LPPDLCRRATGEVLAILVILTRLPQIRGSPPCRRRCRHRRAPAASGIRFLDQGPTTRPDEHRTAPRVAETEPVRRSTNTSRPLGNVSLRVIESAPRQALRSRRLGTPRFQRRLNRRRVPVGVEPRKQKLAGMTGFEPATP